MSSSTCGDPASFPDEVTLAFGKRRRALASRGLRVEQTPVREIVDGRESDRKRIDMELVYRVDGGRVRFRLHVWSDRWVWIDMRRASKTGWVWEFTAEGRVMPNVSGRDLVMRAEESVDASFLVESEVPKKLCAIWSSAIASGPRAI